MNSDEEHTPPLPAKEEPKEEKKTPSHRTADDTLKYDDDSLLSRLLSLDSPVLYENMLPFLCEKDHLDRLLEYLIKDYIRKDSSVGDGSEFTDACCEKINSFLMSNVECLKVLLVKTKGYPVLRVLDAFLFNNSRGTVNNYELATFIKYVLIMLPDLVFPLFQEEDIRQMLTTIAKNRPVYDILVLVLSYPEKRSVIEADAKSPIVDEEAELDRSSDDIDACYNIKPSVLLRHTRFLARLHVIPSMILLLTDSATDAETSDLLCVLLADLLYKYSYNEKYAALIAELPNEDLVHLLMMRVKTHPNAYILRLCERLLYLISVCEIPVAPDNYIKFGLLVDDYMENRFAALAAPLYSAVSIYVMFLIKQLYRHLPAPAQLAAALEARFHLIDTFQLGDLTHANPLRERDDMRVGANAVGLLKIIYYIVLGFYCRQGENLTIVADINPQFWSLLYALPLVYPQHHILQAVLREYHALFIFNRYDGVLLYVVNETPCMQYYYEEYVKKDSKLRGFIRRVVNQLRLRAEQIQLEGVKVPEEKTLVTSLSRDYYYQKLLPLVMSDAVKEVCLRHQKKILRKGVMTNVRECEVDVLLKEAESSKCLDIGSEYAKQLGFHLYE